MNSERYSSTPDEVANLKSAPSQKGRVPPYATSSKKPANKRKVLLGCCMNRKLDLFDSLMDP